MYVDYQTDLTSKYTTLFTYFYLTKRKEGIILFNDTPNTFYLSYTALDIIFMVKNQSDRNRGNLLVQLLFPDSCKVFFICIIPDRTAHTMAIGIPVMENWLD